MDGEVPQEDKATTRDGEGKVAAALHEGDGRLPVAVAATEGGWRQMRDGEGEGEAAAIESARVGRQPRVLLV